MWLWKAFFSRSHLGGAPALQGDVAWHFTFKQFSAARDLDLVFKQSLPFVLKTNLGSILVHCYAPDVYIFYLFDLFT